MMKYSIFMATLYMIPNIYWIYKHWISTIGFNTVSGYFKITKIWPSSIMRAWFKRKNQLLRIEGNNSFKDLLIKMYFSRAVLSKDLRNLENLNKVHVCEFLLWKNVVLKPFKWISVSCPKQVNQLLCFVPKHSINGTQI